MNIRLPRSLQLQDDFGWKRGARGSRAAVAAVRLACCTTVLPSIKVSTQGKTLQGLKLSTLRALASEPRMRVRSYRSHVARVFVLRAEKKTCRTVRAYCVTVRMQHASVCKPNILAHQYLKCEYLLSDTVSVVELPEQDGLIKTDPSPHPPPAFMRIRSAPVV